MQRLNLYHQFRYPLSHTHYLSLFLPLGCVLCSIQLQPVTDSSPSVHCTPKSEGKGKGKRPKQLDTPKWRGLSLKLAA